VAKIIFLYFITAEAFPTDWPAGGPDGLEAQPRKIKENHIGLVISEPYLDFFFAFWPKHEIVLHKKIH
jgi:hypothetical protein